MVSTERRGLGPRVVNGIIAKVLKRVNSDLQSASSSALPQLSPRSVGSNVHLTPSEIDTVTSSVEHFVRSQHQAAQPITEGQLLELAKVLCSSIEARRRDKVISSNPVLLPQSPVQREPPQPAAAPPHGICEPPQHSAAARSPRRPQDVSSTALPPIAVVSPRKAPAHSEVSVAPYATSSSDAAHAAERAIHAAAVKAFKKQLSSELEQQLRQKQAEISSRRKDHDDEVAARLAQLEHAKKLAEELKAKKQHLHALQGEEYHHFVNVRDIDEQKDKLQKLLENHLERKQIAAQSAAEMEVAAKRRRQHEEAAALERQLNEATERKKNNDRELKIAVADPFHIGESEEAAHQRAILRRISLARGLEQQMMQQPKLSPVKGR